jgi:hemerythrin-like domain-containing protein
MSSAASQGREPEQQGIREPGAGMAEARALMAQSAEITPEAFLDPLEFIRDDHFRQLRMCNLMDAFSYRMEVEPINDLAGTLLAFLERDLALHTADEEEDLFPLLRKRCPPEEEIDEVLRQLSREHELDRDLVEFIVADLDALAQGLKVSHPTRLLMNIREFAELQRRHLTWENRVVLPMARQKLTQEDLTRIGRHMAERRQLDYPEQVRRAGAGQ